MPTKKQLEMEIHSIRMQLHQEREDNARYVNELRATAYRMACERMQVKQVLAQRDGYYEALPVVAIEKGSDGVNIVVEPR